MIFQTDERERGRAGALEEDKGLAKGNRQEEMVVMTVGGAREE